MRSIARRRRFQRTNCTDWFHSFDAPRYPSRNLAEGYGRNSTKELHYFIGNSRGSIAEVETQIEIARDLGYFPVARATELLAQAAEIGRMLTGLRDWSEQQASETKKKGITSC